MVHALHEAWRVLVPKGLLIDLRPYNVDAPIEVVSREAVEPAGLADTSLDTVHDEAAEIAISTIMQEGIIRELKLEYFDQNYYWNSVKGMLADVDERWKDDMVIPEVVLRRATILYKKHHGHARLRLRFHTKLVVYEKL
jgi:hypothetical protein